ncbi:hypothetical protein GCM10027033_18580 [Leucobacter ruminantium]
MHDVGTTIARRAALLSAEAGVAVSPRVAVTLGDFACDATEALRELASVIPPAALGGRSALPEVLPIVPSMREAVSLERYNAAERRVLLRASLNATRSVEVLLSASAVDTSVLLLGPLSSVLRIEQGRAEFVDERMRSLIIEETGAFERRRAHAELGRAAERAGYASAALLHEARAAESGVQRSLARRLVQEAATQLERGFTGNAIMLARQARTAAPEQATATRSLLARAAFWHGCFDDARAMIGDSASHDPQLVELARLMEKIDAGPEPGADDRLRALRVKEWLLEAAEAQNDLKILETVMAAEQFWYAGNADEADDLHARMLLSAGVAPGITGWENGTAQPTPLLQAHVCVIRAELSMRAGDMAEAARVLVAGVRELPMELAAAGVVPKFVRTIGASGTDIDVALADHYDRLLRTTSVKYVPIGPLKAERAVAAMRASGGRPSGPPTSDSAPELRSLLTPRQCAVWDLLAGGLSNREIGESLGISERTVEVHVAAILRKAGVTSRSRLLALLNQ